MNQYQIANSVYLIDGYYFPEPGKDKTQSFNKAKQETIKHLQQQLEHVHNITEADFEKWKK